MPLPHKPGFCSFNGKDGILTRLPQKFDAYVAPARRSPQVWRLILGLILAALVYVLLNAAALMAYAWFHGIDAVEPLLARLTVASTPATALALLASFAPLAVGVMVAARLLQKRGPSTLFGPLRPMARDFLRAMLVSVIVFGALTLLGLALIESDPYLPPDIWLMVLPLTLLAIAGQTLAEELLFRAYLQQQIAARTAWRLFWLVLPSLLFGALHYDPASFGEFGVVPVIFACLFGLMAADLTARTGTIGAAWGMHFTINLFALAFVGTSGSITGLALRTVSFDPTGETALSVLALTDAVPLLLVWLILRRWARR